MRKIIKAGSGEMTVVIPADLAGIIALMASLDGKSVQAEAIQIIQYAVDLDWDRRVASASDLTIRREVLS